MTKKNWISTFKKGLINEWMLRKYVNGLGSPESCSQKLRSLTIIWLDLANVYELAPLELIHFALSRSKIPED